MVKSLEAKPCGPVGLLRTQKVGIKYRKPTALVVQCNVDVVVHEEAEHADGVGATKSLEMQGRTGGLATHFLPRNLAELIFFESDCRLS